MKAVNHRIVLQSPTTHQTSRWRGHLVSQHSPLPSLCHRSAPRTASCRFLKDRAVSRQLATTSTRRHEMLLCGVGTYRWCCWGCTPLWRTPPRWLDLLLSPLGVQETTIRTTAAQPVENRQYCAHRYQYFNTELLGIIVWVFQPQDVFMRGLLLQYKCCYQYPIVVSVKTLYIDDFRYLTVIPVSIPDTDIVTDTRH